MPVIQKRISNYLQDDVFKEEFAHTLLHNQNVFEEFRKIRARVGEAAADANGAAEVSNSQSSGAEAASLFHPPQSFVEKGGQEDLYKHEIGKMIQGVQLQSSS